MFTPPYHRQHALRLSHPRTPRTRVIWPRGLSWLMSLLQYTYQESGLLPPFYQRYKEKVPCKVTHMFGMSPPTVLLLASGPFRVIWAMTFRSQFAQSLVDLHTQSELDPLKQVDAFYGGGAAVLEEGTGGRLRHRRISEARVLKSRCYLLRDLMMQNAPLLLETLLLWIIYKVSHEIFFFLVFVIKS